MNAKYASTRRVVADLIAAREAQIEALTGSFNAYEDLLVKAAKGLEFYDKLMTNVGKLHGRVKGVIRVQQEDRDAKLAAKMPKMMPIMPPSAIPPPHIRPAAGGVGGPGGPYMPPLQPAAAAPSFNPTVGALPLPPMASAPPVSPAVTPANPEKLTLKQVLEQRKAAAAAVAAGKHAPVASTAPSNSSVPSPQGTTRRLGNQELSTNPELSIRNS